MIYVEQYDNDESAMYDLQRNGEGVYIAYSTLDQGWSEKCRGTVVARLRDTEEGIKVYFENKKITLDYAQAQELYMLLKYYNEDSGLIAFNPSILKLEEKK